MLDIREITIDSEFESLIPALSGDEYTQLMVNIQRDGFIDPIVVWLNRGIIVDGHNRYHIWETSFKDDPKREPSIIEKKFDSREDVVEWIIKHQLGRRNLTDSQRVILALKLRPSLEAKAKENLKAGGSAGGKSASKPLMNSSKASYSHEANKKIGDAIKAANTRKALADAAGVSEQTVHRVEKVLASAAPESLKADMISGKTSINKAHKEVAEKYQTIPAPPKVWSIDDDMSKFRALRDKLEPNWTDDFDRASMQQFFRQFANEI